jgi:UDP-galactopyranose mutase
LNTIGKPEIMSILLNWAETKDVYGLGRWGEHRHFNSDATVELAMNLAEKMICKR